MASVAGDRGFEGSGKAGILSEGAILPGGQGVNPQIRGHGEARVEFFVR